MKYKSPNLTVDGIIVKNGEILLIKRKHSPFKGKWALPGGFVEYNEKLEDAVTREIFEETGLKTNVSKLFNVYSDPKRDPRGHTVTVVFILKILSDRIKHGDDATDAKFFKLDSLPDLSFDHDKIINDLKKS